MIITKIKIMNDYMEGKGISEEHKPNILNIVRDDLWEITIEDNEINLFDIENITSPIKKIIVNNIDHIHKEWFSIKEWLDLKNNLNSTRKNTDYQCTELVLSLLYLGLMVSQLDSIIYFANDMFESNKLICERYILDKYISDLKYSFTKGTITFTFITNFLNQHINLENIKCVYLTGKTYTKSDIFSKLVELNKGYEQYKPNSDIFVEEYTDDIIFGISCKQNNNSPLSNKIAEDYGTEEERLKLTKSRESLLISHGITSDLLKQGINNKPLKRDLEKKISSILCNKQCLEEPLPEYWKELTNHIIKYKLNFIDGVLHSISQSSYLPYEVYEYDGTTLINTKDRMFDKSECDIRVSNIFCYGLTKPREACKIWFDFLHKGEVKYNLEIRFKNKWFGKGGCPQLFIIKPKPLEIEKCIKTREKHISNSS